MTLKGMILKLIQNFGLKQPTRFEPMNDKDTDNNRIIWQFDNGMLVFDVLDTNVNYMYMAEGQETKIYTLHNIDEVAVIALKYLR